MILIFLLLGVCLSVNFSHEKKTETDSLLEAEPTRTAVLPTNSPTPAPTEAPVELVVYSQLSSFQGEQQGWFAKLLLDKFNVKLQILPELPDAEEELDRADIIVFGGVGSGTDNMYRSAAEAGKLLDWEADNLLAEQGAYILEHMAKALEYNRTLQPETGKIYGLGHRVALSADSIDDFVYTWDIRWDLYQQLGYPEVKNLEDFATVLGQMKQLCPTDENGEETYAMSLWSEWDETMVFYVKSMIAAYYGYEECGLGLYDTTTGSFYGALEIGGPYLQMVRFFNTLYRNGLLDPESKTQNYAEGLAKLNCGGAFFSVHRYSGSMAYNTDNHMKAERYMASLVPEEATPLTYGLSTTGGGRIWAINAETKYPELCMKILNWLCTPEGVMSSAYGPQGVIWDYDEEGNTYFTEFGLLCREDGDVMMTGEYEGTSYKEGFSQINNVTWNIYSENPDSNGEPYYWEHWRSNVPEAACAMEQDWRMQTGELSTREYLKNQNYLVVPATAYEAAELTEELAAAQKAVADCIIHGTWKAIYADSDEEFAAVWMKMTEDAIEKGYTECINFWTLEAAGRYTLEEGARE